MDAELHFHLTGLEDDMKKSKAATTLQVESLESEEAFHNRLYYQRQLSDRIGNEADEKS